MDPSKNTNSTPNNSPPVSPPHSPSEHDNTPTETNPILEAEGSLENVIMKTVEEVWAELTAGDDEIYGNESGDGGNEDGGDQDGDASRPLVIAVTADCANVPVMGSGGGVGGSGKGSKKRKSNQVDEEVQHVVRGLIVDLNRSLVAEEGPSAGDGSGGKKRSQPAGSATALGPPLPPTQSGNRRNEPAPLETADDENEEGIKFFDLNRLPSSDDDESGEN
ncbi:hypothetical protein KIW84_073900 [Lathyrus oleraceus]|uniref:Uncharacterized protein n=1 Tax=Pisum sativum TaxID=3888 RepID=A0A9D4ZXY1_PEA|nr:hypothetical protein KIW84_073900 [Pisum sativum]